MPKISIVIPAYNVGDYLQECLDSVRNQTFSDIEAIVVNDASPDNVGEIAARAATEDPRIRVITNNPNMGTHRTRMAGVENASGEYTFFLDGDDALKPDMCEQLAAEICTQAIADDGNIPLIDDIHQLAHLRREVIHQLVGLQLLVRQRLKALHRLPAAVEQADVDVGSAHVDADCVFFHKPPDLPP